MPNVFNENEKGSPIQGEVKKKHTKWVTPYGPLMTLISYFIICRR